MRENVSRAGIRAAFAAIAAMPGVAMATDLPSKTSAVMTKRVAESARNVAFEIVMDYARILRLGADARTIVIGNPAVLDATLNDARTVVLTGKILGTTNLIVLDENSKEVENLLVSVVQGRHVVTVYRGVQKETYSCVRSCRPTLQPGDSAPAQRTQEATHGDTTKQ